MDDSNLTSRIKRYAQVSTAVGGLAARLAGEKYLGIDINREKHAHDLTKLLGGLKGPLMKVAQFLATVPGALPPEYAEELMELQSNAPSMGWPFVRRRMANELGPNWMEHFQEFAQEAAAAASLGQVHRATLASTGDLVACKLQYPDMESVIEADLNQLDVIFSFYKTWNKALDPSHIRHEIEERLREELDYLNEARNLKVYGRIFEGNPRIHLPRVYGDLTTKRLLTMSWSEGVSLLELVNAPQDHRNDIAKTLFHAWYHPFYTYGIIHGDPHPGNYRATEDNHLNLLDLGCIRVFPGKFVGGVIQLYRALQENDRDGAVQAYETWGFTNLTNDVIDIITAWAKLLYDPLLDDRVRLIQADTAGQQGWDTASKVHEELNKVGGIRPPREFVFMDRAAVGIGSVMMRLKAEANWHNLFNELIEGFEAEKMDQRQKDLLA